MQGDWGERILGELLDSQGLTQGVHYDVQTYLRDAKGEIVTTDEGAKMRPDVILHLDQRREVIIDSKVSMTAYLDYVNAETEDDRNRYLRQHIDSLQTETVVLTDGTQIPVSRKYPTSCVVKVRQTVPYRSPSRTPRWTAALA